MEQAKLSSDHHESAWKNFFGEGGRVVFCSKFKRKYYFRRQ